METGKLKKRSLLREIFLNKYLYLIVLPPILWYAVFHYAPMYGITLAFKKYMVRQGIWGSPWVGLDNFAFMTRDIQFWYAVRNSLIISFGKLIFGFPAPLILALLLNELASQKYKKVVQSILYLPHFLSWVIIAGLIYNLLSISAGSVNRLIRSMGLEPILFLGNAKYFRPIVYITDIWKGAGWGTIIYLAAISGVNPELYEAARIDGAGRFKRMVYITIPSIKATVIILLILSMGGIMNAGFDQIFNLYSPGVYSVGDIIETFVYRMGIERGKFEYTAAIGLFNSLINLTMILTANAIARLVNEDSLF